MYGFLLSLWRTVVPMIVGFTGAQLARYGLHLDDGQLTAALTAGFSAGYYALFRALEHAHPGWGWFLGIARPPAYERPADADVAGLARGGR